MSHTRLTTNAIPVLLVQRRLWCMIGGYLWALAYQPETPPWVKSKPIQQYHEEFFMRDIQQIAIGIREAVATIISPTEEHPLILQPGCALAHFQELTDEDIANMDIDGDNKVSTSINHFYDFLTNFVL